MQEVKAKMKKGPIRVLHIVTYMGRGGLETMLMNYYRNIDRTKVQFDFLVHRDFEADYDKEIILLGGKIYHISRLIPWSKEYKNKLKEFFKSHPEYKIVHVHQDCLSSIALCCAKECGIPVRIAHCHSSSAVKNIKYPIKLFYMKKIPKYSTKMFACGNEAGNWMFGKNEFEVVQNAIDVVKYRYSEEISAKIRRKLQITNEFVVGHVGSFSPAKNHKFLIAVFNELLKIEENSKLLLVGDGNGRKEIETQIHHLGIEDKVILTGVRSDVNEILQAIDIFVFPSLYEGLGIAAIEAQAAGIPCILSNKVPTECKQTENVEFLELDSLPNNWVQHILNHRFDKKTDQYLTICKSGYDIREKATWLENFYLNEVHAND